MWVPPRELETQGFLQIVHPLPEVTGPGSGLVIVQSFEQLFEGVDLEAEFAPGAGSRPTSLN